jgi:hypothetical protein
MDAKFYKSRNGWLEVAKAPRLKGGNGWDIVLRIDGTYFDEAHAEEMVEYWTQVLADQRTLAE